MTLFWLWSPHVIWKFVPDPRTNLWKGSLTKGFCFDGGYTNSAVVTGRKELPRWCVNPEPRGANAQWVWCGLTWKLWLLVLQLHFRLSKVYSECTTVHLSGKFEGTNECFCGVDGYVLTNWMNSSKFNIRYIASICHLLMLRVVTSTFLTWSEKSPSVSPVATDWATGPGAADLLDLLDTTGIASVFPSVSCNLFSHPGLNIRNTFLHNWNGCIKLVQSARCLQVDHLRMADDI